MVNFFDNLKTAYSGKRVLLTGHTGFKGSWFLKILSLLGAEVKGYSLEPENDHNLYNIIKGDTLCKSIIGDIRDKQRLKDTVTEFQPDFIFHLAAQSLVGLSYQIPSETFEINVIGTANLLDAVKDVEKPCNCVLITTDKVYHNNEWDYPYRENDKLGGYDPYSASKACTELVIDSYRNSFFNINNFHSHYKAIAVGRAGNVIGGGDWAINRLLPDIAKSLSKNQKIIIRHPNSTRPWQHVLEPLFGYLLLGSKLVLSPLKHSSAYNFGPNLIDVLSVEEIVKMAITSWGSGNYEIDKNNNSKHEAGLLKLDISKADSQLNWIPQMNANEAINSTVEWYKNFYLGKINMVEFTDIQINNFIYG